MIAGGVGITPLRALFEELSKERGQLVVLVYRVSSEDDIIFRRELDEIAGQHGSRVIYAIGARNSDADIVRPGVLQQHLPNLEDCDAFICGPKGLVDQAKAALRSAKVKSKNIHVEDFSF